MRGLDPRIHRKKFLRSGWIAESTARLRASSTRYARQWRRRLLERQRDVPSGTATARGLLRRSRREPGIGLKAPGIVLSVLLLLHSLISLSPYFFFEVVGFRTGRC